MNKIQKERKGGARDQWGEEKGLKRRKKKKKTRQRGTIKKKTHWKSVFVFSGIHGNKMGTNRYFHHLVVTEKVWELSAAEYILDQNKMTSFHLTLTPFSRHP